MTNNNRMNQSPSKGATGPRMLPVVRIDGELYFVDHRLRELRNVQNPFERLPISMASGLPYLDIKPEDLPRPIIHGGDAPSFSRAEAVESLSGQAGQRGMTWSPSSKPPLSLKADLRRPPRWAG